MLVSISRDPNGLSTWRRGWHLAFPLLAFMALGQTWAAAQTTGAASRPAAQYAAPLPAVVYPSRDPDTGPPDIRFPGAPSTQAQVTEEGEPVQYYLDNGVWGYWDRTRRFHPMQVSAPLRQPEHAHLIPRTAGALPNPTPRRIVVQHVMSPNRTPPR
jgi:hypothetical protein